MKFSLNIEIPQKGGWSHEDTRRAIERSIYAWGCANRGTLSNVRVGDAQPITIGNMVIGNWSITKA